jgi:hypothetical protein
MKRLREVYLPVGYAERNTNTAKCALWNRVVGVFFHPSKERGVFVSLSMYTGGRC